MFRLLKLHHSVLKMHELSVRRGSHHAECPHYEMEYG